MEETGISSLPQKKWTTRFYLIGMLAIPLLCMVIYLKGVSHDPQSELTADNNTQQQETIEEAQSQSLNTSFNPHELNTEQLQLLEDRLKTVLIPVFESANEFDDINMAAVDVFVAHMTDNLSESELTSIQSLIQSHLDSDVGFELSNAIDKMYRLKVLENEYMQRDSELSYELHSSYERLVSLHGGQF